MAGLWDSKSKKESTANLWGQDSGKSVYETYGGKQEEDERPAYEDLTDEEKKIIEFYNDKVKNVDAFKKSREIWEGMLKDENSEDHELAKKLDAYIIKDPKQIKYTESFGEAVVRNFNNASNFVEESNKAFLGGIIEGGANAVNFIGSGFNADETKKRTDDFMDRAGIRDKVTGLSSTESTKGGLWNLQRKTDEEIRQEQVENMTDDWSKAGKIAGDSQRIAADIMTTLIPGAAAEKIFRGIGWLSKLSQGGAAARTASNVAANVVGGAAATGAGVVKDPTQLTPENLATNTATDVAIGLTGSGLSTITRIMRNAKNSKQLAAALSEVDSAELSKSFADKLNALQKSDLSGKAFKKEADAILEEAHNTKKFDVLVDGATMNSATIKTRLDDIDKRLAEADTPEYAANNGLLNTEAAKARYDELMANPEKIPGVSEANRAITEAEEQLKYYNKIRVDEPFARKVDKIRDKITKIEQAKQAELDYLARMSEDEVSEFDPRAFDELNATATKQYDELIAKEQSKIDKLMASDPEKAAELQMLDEAEKTVELQRMDAQEKLDTLTKNQAEIAAKEAEEIAKTPNVEAIEQHKKFLEQKKQVLNKRYEDAKKRYESPNQKLEDVDEELIYMKEGTHPLVAEGKIHKAKERAVELTQEKTYMEANRQVEDTPDGIVEPTAQETLRREAMEQVAAKRPGLFTTLTRAWEQHAEVLKNAGYGKLAEIRTRAEIDCNIATNEYRGKMREWSKTAKGNSSQQLFEAANGNKDVYNNLTPGGRKVVDEWQGLRRELGEKMGLPKELLEKDFYIPHLFVDVHKQPKLIEIQQRIKTVQDDIDAGKFDGSELKRKETHLKKLNKQIEELVGDENLKNFHDFVQENGNYTNRFLKQRNDAEGFETNFWRATSAYSESANRKIHLEPAMMAFAEAKMTTPDKGMGKWFQTEIDKMRGTKHDMDRMLDDMTNSVTEALPMADKTHNLGTKSLRGFRRMTSLGYLGGSITAPINTLTQVVMLAPRLDLDGTAYGLAKAFEMSGRLAKSILTRTEVDRLKYMQRIGVFEGSSMILPDETFVKWFDKGQKVAFAGITGADRFLRIATFEGATMKAERIGKAKGLSGDDLRVFVENEAYDAVNAVNQNFSKLGTPHVFRSQVAKTLGSMVTFVPGMVVRSADVVGKGLKGGYDIIGKTATGKKITRAEFVADVNAMARVAYLGAGVWAAGEAWKNMTGQDEVIPNPFTQDFYQSPVLQFLTGNEKGKEGLLDLLPKSDDAQDEQGNNLDVGKRRESFMTGTLPYFVIPGWAQIKRTTDATKVNEQGYSETDTGRIRYMADEEFNLQRMATGQYSTPEGREYIENMNKPGGGSLSESDSKKIKEAPEYLKQQYYDFFRATDRITGRSDANKEVTRLFRDEKRPEAARRKAKEFNKKVDEKLVDFFNKYPYIDDDLRDELKRNVYITLTNQSEKSRSKTDD